MRKKRYLLNHKKSSALVVSVAIHAVFLIVALSFVAVKVIIRPDQDVFEAKEITRPAMKLKRLQVPVKDQKKTQAPKLRKTIVSKPKTATVDIKMPEIVGVKGGTGYGRGGGLGGLGFGFDLDLFGSSKSKGTGNEFIGHFYDLKQTAKGEPTAIGKLAEKNSFNNEAQDLCRQVINGFVRSGMKASDLKDYFVAPKPKYATTFNFPPMEAVAAPKAFGVEDKVKPSYWICVYRGQIVAPEDGEYRFWGEADDVLVVRVNKRIVLDGSWPETSGKLTTWSSRADDNRRYPINVDKYGTFKGGNFMDYFETIRSRLDSGESIGGILGDIKIEDKSLTALGNYMNICNRLAIGDWFPLKKGQRVDMEVLIGEIPGGAFNCRLLIQQKQGVQYTKADSDAGERWVLPVFKTVPVDEKLVSLMEANPKEMTLDGPSFGAADAAQTK